MKKFKAYVVTSGGGEDTQKHLVASSLDEAIRFSHTYPQHVDITVVNLSSKEDLQDLIEDNLSDAQADEFEAQQEEAERVDAIRADQDDYGDLGENDPMNF